MKVHSFRRHPIAGNKISGHITASKTFPDGKPGRVASSVASPLPGAYSLDAYADYFASNIAKHLERLNAIQYNIDAALPGNQGTVAQQINEFRTTFQNLAAFLEVPPNDALVWPLNGLYRFHSTAATQALHRPDGHDLVLAFEADQLTGLVLNFSVVVEESPAAGPGGPVGLSSSSSYMSTGSSY